MAFRVNQKVVLMDEEFKELSKLAVRELKKISLKERKNKTKEFLSRLPIRRTLRRY
jgi:hypothetical protein